MKLGVALGFGVFLVGAGACSASNMQYHRDLQDCIKHARDAGDSGAERLAAYTQCADALDKDGGK